MKALKNWLPPIRIYTLLLQTKHIFTNVNVRVNYIHTEFTTVLQEEQQTVYVPYCNCDSLRHSNQRGSRCVCAHAPYARDWNLLNSSISWGPCKFPVPPRAPMQGLKGWAGCGPPKLPSQFKASVAVDSEKLGRWVHRGMHSDADAKNQLL